MGPLDADLSNEWTTYKRSIAGVRTLWIINLGFIIVLIIIELMLVPEEVRPADLVLGMGFSIAAVLFAYLLLSVIALSREGPSPAVYRDGIVLVRIEPIRLGTFSYAYLFKDLQSPRSVPLGLRVRSKDGQSWLLLRGVFKSAWLVEIEGRVLRGLMGGDLPRLVLYPKAETR